MENQHLTYFKVENFKRFESLELNNIGQFNLIVGDNNVGKTSVLEALLVDTHNFNQILTNFCSALSHNRKVTFKTREAFDTFNYLDFYFKNRNLSIVFEFQEEGQPQEKIELSTLSKAELSLDQINSLGAKNLIHQTSNFLAKVKKGEREEFLYTSFMKEPGTYNSYLPLIAFEFGYNDDLLGFFSQISQKTSNYNVLINELSRLIPDIKSIEINNAIIKDKSVLVIREDSEDEIRPVSFYGEGLNKYFRYLLEIFMCAGQRIMIDEIDTGVHYSRMKDNFKSIFQLALDHKVQLFATTHSKEALQYYKEALEELGYQDKGRVIRLVEHKHKIVKAYTYTFEQFEHSIDYDNEIR